jgi:hypothetical protein
MMSRGAKDVCPIAGAYAERMPTAPRAEEPQVDAPVDPIDDSTVDPSVDPTVDPSVDPTSATADELHDTALHEEIELVGQLVVAATSTPHRLSAQEIDKILGVEHDE